MTTMTCEKDVKRNVRTLLKKYGAWYFMPSMNGFGRAGVPDFIVCIQGKFLAIETKFGTNKPTDNQKKEIHEIQRAEGMAMVIRETEMTMLEDILSELSERDPV